MFELPPNPSEEQLKQLQEYIKFQKKNLKKKEDYYQDKKDLIIGKLILFKHKQMQSNNFYMRMYCGNKKYKTLSLKTTDESIATSRALEKWHLLQSHLDSGNSVIEETLEKYLEDYVLWLQKQLSIKGAIKSKKTYTAKLTSLKKLKTKLKPFKKPSDIDPKFLRDYKCYKRFVFL